MTSFYISTRQSHLEKILLDSGLGSIWSVSVTRFPGHTWKHFMEKACACLLEGSARQSVSWRYSLRKLRTCLFLSTTANKQLRLCFNFEKKSLRTLFLEDEDLMKIHLVIWTFWVWNCSYFHFLVTQAYIWSIIITSIDNHGLESPALQNG